MLQRRESGPDIGHVERLYERRMRAAGDRAFAWWDNPLPANALSGAEIYRTLQHCAEDDVRREREREGAWEIRNFFYSTELRAVNILTW